MDRAKRTRPSPLAPWMLVIVADGQSTAFTVVPGQRVTIGRDPGANIVVDDSNVSANHTQVERRGPGWLVNSLDAANPTWILDTTGRTQPIDGELGLRSGELLIGKCQVMLYPPDPRYNQTPGPVAQR